MLDFFSNLPWPAIPGVIAGAIAFVLQFVVKAHVDREKAAYAESFFTRNYLFRMPPRETLTSSGLKWYWLLFASTCVFVGSIVATVALYWNRPKI